MSIQLNSKKIASRCSTSGRLHFGSKEDVSLSKLFRMFHRAFPLAFDRSTFERIYNGSDVSRTAYHSHCCSRISIDGAVLASSTFDEERKRQLKILMLVENGRHSSSFEVGKRLLSQVIEIAKELENIQSIFAFVETTNLDGIRFYRSMNFQQKEIFRNYFPEKNDRNSDAVKFELVLASASRNSTNKILLSPISTLKYSVSFEQFDKYFFRTIEFHFAQD